VLKPETLAAMFAHQYQPDPRIPGLGLAFFRGNAGGRTVLEHQGLVPAFTSQIFLAPDDGSGLMAYTNGTRNGMFWLPVETERLFVRGVRSNRPRLAGVCSSLRGKPAGADSLASWLTTLGRRRPNVPGSTLRTSTV
jgi:hypothetical protein